MLKIFRVFNRMNYKNTRIDIKAEEISYEELLIKVKQGAKLLDVRTRQEFSEGHLNGSIVVPYYEIDKKIENLIPNKEQAIVVYCQNGGRSLKAIRILEKKGYKNLYNLKDGIEAIG